MYSMFKLCIMEDMFSGLGPASSKSLCVPGTSVNIVDEVLYL